MPHSNRPAHRRPPLVAALAVGALAIAGCGGKDDPGATATGPMTVVAIGGTETRVVTTDGAAATTTSVGRKQVPLHGVRRRPVHEDQDRADLRATDGLIEELHDRGQISRLGIVEVDATGPLVIAQTSRPGRAVEACRAIRAAASAQGLGPLQGVLVQSDDPADDGSAQYLADETNGCERQ